MPGKRTFKNGTFKWKARIRHNYREEFIGYFDDYDEAVKAEQDLREELTGYPTRKRR